MAKQNKELSLRLYSKEKRDWTEGTISNIFEDAENRIKNVEYFKFNNFNTFEYMDTQISLTEFYCRHIANALSLCAIRETEINLHKGLFFTKI